jgi:hypothetical protein
MISPKEPAITAAAQQDNQLLRAISLLSAKAEVY